MASQLSKKAALPLAKILATCRNNVSNTGPWISSDSIPWCFLYIYIYIYTGVYWFHIVRLSVCGRNRVRSISSTILTGPISYLHILSSNFRRCVVRNVCFKFLKKNEVLANSLKFVTLSCFDWDPIWINSMGNHGAAWVCWKRRRAIRFRLVNDVLYTCLSYVVFEWECVVTSCSLYVYTWICMESSLTWLNCWNFNCKLAYYSCY